uniref:DNA-(Apurinic or apyrimidinic site) lyase 2 n=1 Tax=Tanacetum cinerariifolium TaxID=118510 RepID=A0A699K2L9_TANCI|nr:DNA-(apurinic or apyrimidinic site) lyase 2 [Tanacetum cinerariifolium]
MSTSSSSNQSHVRNLPTHCNCGIHLAKRVSWTKRNPCYHFLVCSKPSFFLDKCDAFYWIDGELQVAWYKHAMYKIYLSMNGDQRDVSVEEINKHELGILTQEGLAYDEAEFENYKARMVLQLRREQSKYAV